MGQLMQAIPRALRLGQRACLRPSEQVRIALPDICFGEFVGNGAQEGHLSSASVLVTGSVPTSSSAGDRDSMALVIASPITAAPRARRIVPRALIGMWL